MKDSPRSRFGSEQGFSLIEMIVAITLVAMMALGLWAVLRISISSWSRGSEYIDTNQRHRSILGLVKKQIASIYGVIAPVDLLSGGVAYPIFAGAATSVQFISLSSMHFQENPGLTMVSYDVVQDRGAYSLVEREELYLGVPAGQEGLLDRKDQSVTGIFDNLDSLTFEYFDPGSSDRPSGWVKEWDAREARSLPAAISMTMVFRDSKGGLLNRQIVIPVAAKPYYPGLTIANPFDARPRRPNARSTQ